jgi:hypothetical protein
MASQSWWFLRRKASSLRGRIIVNKRLIADTIRLTFAQAGLKRGKRDSIAMLLEPSDLPGGDWKAASVITIRSGVIGGRDDVARRARELHCVAAWRRYNQGSSSYDLSIQLGPLASIGDAESRVQAFESQMMERLNLVKGVVGINTVHDLEWVGPREATGVEYVVTAGRVANRKFKDVRLNVEEVLFTVSCSGFGDGWAWNEVMKIAALQVEKITSIRSPS